MQPYNSGNIDNMAGKDAPKAKSSKGSGSHGKPITDPRFSHLQNDPRYRLPSRKDTHVKVDKRFSRMLDDDSFVRRAKVDKYGRRLPSSTGRKTLERLYEFEDEDDEDDDAELEADDDDEVQRELKRVEGLPRDPTREGFEPGSSEDEESSSSDESDSEEEVEEEADQQLESGAGDVETGEVTSRIAVVNLDWDHIRAVDLMAVASSFCPSDGRILNVTVYPSEFGRERMEREETEGPARELFAGKSKSGAATEVDDDESSDSESEDDEQIKQRLLKQSTTEEANTEVDGRALRNYQLSRLRYYYAVITCDSTRTAEALYNEMDGSEYLTSANFFDLRFIPDETTFDDPVTDKPRDACTKVPNGYRPAEFVTEALTHSKVNLTWDQDDVGRKEAQKRAFTSAEIDDNDLQAYLGSDSDGEEEEELAEIASKPSKKDDARKKMRALLGLPEEAEPGKRSSKTKERDVPSGDMQITFTAGLTGDDDKDPSAVFANKLSDVTESTRDRYVRKERERKARRREKAKALRNGTANADAVADAEVNADVDMAAGEDEKAGDGNDAADPFDDPFFADPDSANQAARRDAKKIARAEKQAKADAESARRAAERAELAAVMGDEGARADDTHFDMAQLRKREKEERRAGKKHKGRKRGRGSDDDAEPVAKDTFDVDVADPRFGRLFESHEYAIDPTNARYSGTKGMKKLLDEGRKRRDRDVDPVDDEAVEKKTKSAKKESGGELDGLVQKIKRRKAA